MATARGGWNQRIPLSVARCACPARRVSWARLLPQSGAPCCGAPCCRAPHAAIVSTRMDIMRLRALALRQNWLCPRCGAAISLHQRNFECLDTQTRAVRYVREWYGSIRAYVAYAAAQPDRRR